MPNHQILFCLGILFNRSAVQLFNRVNERKKLEYKNNKYFRPGVKFAQKGSI